MSPLILLLGLAGSPQAADDIPWPDYRGPSYDGHAPAGANLPLTWSDTEEGSENVAWKTEIWGRGWSSPVIGQGLIWITTADPEGHKLGVLAIDAETGEVVHDRVLFEVPEPMERNKLNSYASPSPAVMLGKVVVCFGSAGVACLDIGTGEDIWRRTDIVCDHMQGPGSSPVIVDDTVVIHYDGGDVQFAACLTLRLGGIRWKSERSYDWGDLVPDLRKAYSTPVPMRVGDQTVLISPGAQATYALESKKGKELWRVDHSGFSMSARPIIAGDSVLVNTGFMKPQLWKLRLGGEGDVTESHVDWKIDKGIPSMSTGVVVGDLVFQVADSGVVSCHSMTDGSRKWRERICESISSSLLACGDRVYGFDQNGKGFVFAAKDEYEVLAENQLPEGCMASPAVLGDALIVRTKTHLYRIEAPAEEAGSGN